MVNTSDINTFSLAEIEQIIEFHPWFTFARKEYFERLAAMGQENTSEAARKIGLYVISREYVCKSVKENISRRSHQTEVRNIKESKYVVAGGDYFGKDDFDKLERDGLAFEGLPFASCSHVLNGNSIDETTLPETTVFDDESMVCTETFAGIYAEQGFNQRAIDIYNKLILLYPKKSAYFASLIENVKSKNS